MAKRQRTSHTEEFKEQIVKLYESNKPKKDIMTEYDLAPTALNTWIIGSNIVSKPILLPTLVDLVK